MKSVRQRTDDNPPGALASLDPESDASQVMNRLRHDLESLPLDAAANASPSDLAETRCVPVADVPDSSTSEDVSRPLRRTEGPHRAGWTRRRPRDPCPE